MKLLKKLFFGLNMTWKKVLIFAVVSGVLGAAVLLLPGINSTSVANISVSFEFWILAALIIIMNCEKPLEAGLKTFVYFLISQPLIYLLQVPFNADGWGIFRYYPYWFAWTVLCLPGGMIAWFVKKEKWYSPLILSVATVLLAYEFVYFLRDLIGSFPKGLIATVFTGLLAVVLIFVLLKKREHRLIAGGITLLTAVIVAVLYFLVPAGQTATQDYDLADGHNWEITSQDGYIGEITVDSDEDAHIVIQASQYGSCDLTLTDENGETVSLHIVFDGARGLDVRKISSYQQIGTVSTVGYVP